MADTNIEWADKVWNPTTGCTKVSEGCRNCFAERMAKRLAGMNAMHWMGKRPFEEVLEHPDRIDDPLHWKKPRRIFVDSMGDLFHEDISDLFITKVIFYAGAAKQHQFLILTKRTERMARLSLRLSIPSNVWLGTSIEDQKSSDERLAWLMEIDHPNLFVSAEPLLGEIKLPRKLHLSSWLKWLIIGGESGPGARPCHPDWVRELIYQADGAGVPVFFKQWGMWIHRSQMQWAKVPFEEKDMPAEFGEDAFVRTTKKKAGNCIDGGVREEYPSELAPIRSVAGPSSSCGADAAGSQGPLRSAQAELGERSLQ